MADNPPENNGSPPSKGQSPDPGQTPPTDVKIPDKYVKDGKPDLAAFVAGHNELVGKFTTKTEDLRKEIEAGLFKERPEAADKYAVPDIPNVDKDELANHPMLGWWREQAFTGGLSQKKFDEGIAKYIEVMAPRPIPEDDLKKDLGDNYKQRIAAVEAWAQKTAKSDGEMKVLEAMATSADGIKLFERMMGVAGNMEGDNPPPKQETLTVEQLRAMQNDPKYFDPAQRDPAFIKKVEDGYAKLYPAKRP